MTPAMARAMVSLRRVLPWTENLDEERWAVLAHLVEQHGHEWLVTHRDFVEAVYRGAWDRASSLLVDALAQEAKEQTAKLALQLRTGTWQV